MVDVEMRLMFPKDIGKKFCLEAKVSFGLLRDLGL
jgi:hypothetical protein